MKIDDRDFFRKLDEMVKQLVAKWESETDDNRDRFDRQDHEDDEQDGDDDRPV